MAWEKVQCPVCKGMYRPTGHFEDKADGSGSIGAMRKRFPLHGSRHSRCPASGSIIREEKKNG